MRFQVKWGCIGKWGSGVRELLLTSGKLCLSKILQNVFKINLIQLKATITTYQLLVIRNNTKYSLLHKILFDNIDACNDAGLYKTNLIWNARNSHRVNLNMSRADLEILWLATWYQRQWIVMLIRYRVAPVGGKLNTTAQVMMTHCFKQTDRVT